MANDFLAGTAFIDTNNNGQFDLDENYLAGATIELRSANDNTLVATQVTNDKGAYVFSNVSPGNYQLVNRSAPNYAGSSTQARSGINTVNSSTVNSINVTLRSPTDLKASVDMDRFINQLGIFEDVTVSIGSSTITTSIGQLPAKISGDTLNPNPSPEFLTLSTDLYSLLGPGLNGPYEVNPGLDPVGPGMPHNSGRVSYLYNRYGREQLGAADAAGLQLAVWELLYDADAPDSTGDLNSGDFRVLAASSDAVFLANFYLADSLNKSEVATFLNLPGQSYSPSTGLLVSGSFNFGNVIAAKIGNLVWHDTLVNGQYEAFEPGIPGATVNLYQGTTLIATTTTTSAGLYEFDHLLAGTYRVEFLLPAGFTQFSTADSAPDDVDSDGPVTGNIVLSAGQVNDTIDQGFYKLASLGNFVWNDRNGNGLQAPGEEGIEGAQVNLKLNGNVVATTFTNSQGAYRFENLQPGVYDVEFIKPEAYAFISPQSAENGQFDSDGPFVEALNLESGENEDRIDQGFFGQAKIGNFVWHDLNADGIQDSNEPGIDGVTVELLRGSTVVATRTTAGGGLYSFETGAGTYTVRFTKPASFSNVSPTDATSDDLDSDGLVSAPITVSATGTFNSVDVGFYNLVTIGDFVWHDLDADGIQEAGENGIDGVTVELLKGTTLVATTSTSNGGKYSFNVAPGTYTVQFTRPADFSNVSPTDATSDDLDSDGLSSSVTVLSGGTNNQVDLGLFRLIKIGNFVWHDFDADGVQDVDEPGIDGVTVSLLRDGSEIASSVTTNGGLYTFNVVPGTYSIKFSKPVGFSKASPNSTADETLTTPPLTVRSGDANTELDQGFYNLSRVGNFVWHDLNANGIQDSNEPGIDGVTVSLMQGNTTVATGVTAGGGLYNFDVAPGTYYVKFTQPATFTNVSPTDATDDLLDSDGLTTTTTTLVSGETNNALDLGLFNLAKLGNFVWHDLNANGIQENNEPGIDGVAVSLMQGSNEVATTVTAGGGFYNFDVIPGTYSIRFTRPSGFTNVSPTDATNDDADSDGLVTAAVTVASGVTNNSIDLGLFNLAKIGNFVWHDLNANGIQENNEPGIDGVAVSLMQGSSEVTTTVTTGGGFYNFDVIPGTYSIKFTIPSGFTNVSPTDATNDDADSDGLMTAAVTVASGVTNNSRDLGLFNLVRIGNFVWNDQDTDGIQDPGEPGIDGVSVALLQGTTVVATTVTAGGGQYSFNVIPGTYSVRFTQPANFSNVSPADATNDELDSDGLTTPTVTLTSGQTNNSLDQGFFNTGSNVCVTIDMQGNTPVSGTRGNVRTYSAGGVSVNARAYSRASTGVWSTAYLGSFGGGLGVTDSSETGDGNTHTLDNFGQLNYVVFEFSQQVLVDAAFLGYVAGDSDITVWIGNVNNAFTNHQALSDSFLTGLGFRETNTTTLTGARTADINASGIRGNVLVIAAQVDDTTPEDYFKIANLTVCVPAGPANASIGDLVWHDVNGNGIQEGTEPGIPGATVTLVGGGADTTINGVGDTTITTVTDSAGKYSFGNLTAGTQYRVTFSLPSGFDSATARRVGTNSQIDSDGLTSDVIVLAAGESRTNIDAGFFRFARVGNFVWNDLDRDGIQDIGEGGIGGVQVSLTGTTASGTAISHSTTSASNGAYHFQTLPPGTYSVTVAASNFASGGVLSNFTASPTQVGTNRDVDSNAQPASSTATLVSGGSDFTLDFGYFSTTALACVTMKMEGNSPTSGHTGNVRTFSAGGISVKARAFSRDSWGVWSNAYLGSFWGGLGVTDTSEGSGSGAAHTVDNVGRRNYVLFEFSQVVTIDSAFLGYVVTDSDLTAWIGTVTDPFNNPRNLNDSFLTGLGYSENNDTTLSTSRTADLNAGNRSGNVLVIAASTSGTLNDYFKIAELSLCASVPSQHVGTKFFVVDDSADRTFQYTSSAQYTSNFTVGTASPTGIAANPAGTTTWVSDSNGRVLRYNSDGSLNSSWATHISGTRGVSTNGTSIWTVSNSTDRVYFYSGAASFVPSSTRPNPTLTSSFPLHVSNTNPQDLVTDGNTIWVVDDGHVDMIYAYSMSGHYLGRWQLDVANSTPTGITIDPSGGSKMWIVDAGTDRIYEYSGATGCRSGGLRASRWYALNTGLGNSSPQGIADPPSGTEDEPVLAEVLPASQLVDGSFINPDVNPYHNVISASDVNDDGLTTAIDALVIINRLNSGTAGKLALDAVAMGQRLDLADVNNDGNISPIDALLVINRLNQNATGNRPPAVREPVISNDSSSAAADMVFGELATSAEGEMTAAAMMFEVDNELRRNRR